MRSGRLQLLVLLAAAVLFFWRLGGHDLWAPDEPYFAEGAREMLIDGEWWVPHVNGVVSTDKPPMFFWLIALFSWPLGAVTSWTARLPSVLAALGTIALTMRLGRRFYGPRTAALVGGILATSFLFWDKARWSQTDSLLCFFIWGALSAFEGFRSGTLGGVRAGLLFWGAMALAVLTKGPVGLLLPVGIALTVLATDRQLGRFARMGLAVGPLLFAAILGMWIAGSSRWGPEEYSVWGALREHFVDRGIHGMHHKQPAWYFLEVLPVILLPWIGLLPGAVVLAWRRRSSADRFALAATLFVLVFFSISTEKRELYSLPAFPAIALLIGGLIASISASRDGPLESPLEGRLEAPTAPGPRLSRRWVTIGQRIVGSILALVGAALPFIAAGRQEFPLAIVIAIASVLLVTGGVTFLAAHNDRVLRSALAPAVGFSIAYLLVVTFAYPHLEERKSSRPFALRMAELTAESRAAGLPVLAYGLGNLPEPFAFYSNGVYTLEVDSIDPVRRHLERPEKVFAIVEGGAIAALPEALRERLVVVAEDRLSRREVVLVTNADHPGGIPLADRTGG